MSAPYAALEAEEAYLAPDNSNAGILEITIDNTLIDSSHIDDDYNVFSDAAGQQPIATGKVLADFAEGDTLYTNLDGNNDPSQVRLTPSSFANSVRIESDINIQNSADALEFSIPDGKTVFFDGNLTALADTSVSKTGDGLLEISADNSSSFAGDFSIQAGQVTLKSAADLGGNLSIELPATLLAEGSLSADSIAISGHALLKGSTTVSAEITGSGVLDINSQGSIILDSASSTFDGPISVKDGTLEFAGQKVGGSIALSNDT